MSFQNELFKAIEKSHKTLKKEFKKPIQTKNEGYHKKLKTNYLP